MSTFELDGSGQNFRGSLRQRCLFICCVFGVVFGLMLAAGAGRENSARVAWEGPSSQVRSDRQALDLPGPSEPLAPACGPNWTVVPSSPSNILTGVAVVTANNIWAVGYYFNYAGYYQTLVERWNGTAWSVVFSPNAGSSHNILNGVAAVGPNDVWAVGQYYNGTAYQTLTEHWNGSAWNVVTSPNFGVQHNTLNGVAAIAFNNVWAVGSYYNGTIYRTLVERWNGTTWSVVPSPNVGAGDNILTDVALVSASDVWAVGSYYAAPADQTLIEHWNGTSWSVVSSPNVGTGHNVLKGLAVVSANDVWAVGYYLNTGNIFQTLIERWNGTSWSVVSSPNAGSGHNYLYEVAMVSAGDVWAVGQYHNGTANQTLMERWNGTAWSIVSSPNVGSRNNSLSKVAVVTASDVWAVGNYLSPTEQTLTEHWDGTEWSVEPSPNVGPGYTNFLHDVAAVSANNVWAVGASYNSSNFQTLVERWNGTAWSPMLSPNVGSDYNALFGIAAVTANDVWAVGNYDIGSNTHQTLIEHWNGTAWSVVPSPNVGTDDNILREIAAVAANNVWAVGSYHNGTDYRTLILRWNGTAWSVVPSPNVGTGRNGLGGVAAVSANDIWAVGSYLDAAGNYQTLILRWNGTSWNVVPSPGPSPTMNVLGSVAAVSATDIWAVGYYHDGTTDRTLILHWNGTAWSVVSSPNVGTDINNLYDVSVVSSTEVWAVGRYYDDTLSNFQTLVEHWNGTTWSVVPSPNVATNSNYLTGVTIVSASDVWGVGSYASGSTEQTLVERFNPCSATATPTVTRTSTPSATRTRTNTPTRTPTGALTNTPTRTNTRTPTHTSTATRTNTPILPSSTPTRTPSRTSTPTTTNTPTRTNTPLPTQTPGGPSATPVPTNTPSPTYTHTPTVTNTPLPSATSTSTSTQTSTQTPTTTPTMTPTNTPLPTQTLGGPSATPVPTDTPTATVTDTPTPTFNPAGTATPTSCSIEFPDVPQGSTFYNWIQCLACRGIISGFPDGTFGPNRPVTRAQLSKIVSNSAGYSETYSTATFNDVPVGSTFHQFVERLAARGVVSGYPCGGAEEPCPGVYLRPNADVTRGQTCKIVAVTAGWHNPPAGQQTFEDVPGVSTFWPYIEYLASIGVVQGYACGGAWEPCNPPDNRPYFRPGANVTRGQSAKIVANAFFPDCPTPAR